MNNQPLPSDLPAHARERLQAMRGSGGQQRLFTSDLSVNGVFTRQGDRF